mgnify:CR=1 FL=1|jgi:hypothetical protein
MNYQLILIIISTVAILLGVISLLVSITSKFPSETYAKLSDIANVVTADPTSGSFTVNGDIITNNGSVEAKKGSLWASELYAPVNMHVSQANLTTKYGWGLYQQKK